MSKDQYSEYGAMLAIIGISEYTALQENDRLKLVREFFSYLSGKYKVDINGARKLAEKEDIQLEFFLKARFIKHSYEKRTGEVITYQTAGEVINAVENNDQGLKHKIYDKFMHHVAANKVKPSVIESLVKQWVASARSLGEVDEKGQKPLDLALGHGDLDCIAEFAKYDGVDLRELDKNGFSPLHRLVVQVANGISEPSLITDWCKRGFPTNTPSATGLTPFQFAVGITNAEATFAFIEAGVGKLVVETETTSYSYKDGKFEAIETLNDSELPAELSENNSAVVTSHQVPGITKNLHAVNFIVYLKNRYYANDAVAKLLAMQDRLQLEYLYKVCFVAQKMGILEAQAEFLINTMINASQGFDNQLYDGFMHYVASNSMIPSSVAEDYIDQCLKSGRSLKELDANGHLPSTIAVQKGNLNFIELLQKYNAIDLNQLDNGTTILHYCVAYDRPEIIKALTGKVDFNIKDSDDCPAIAHALMKCKIEVAKALVDGGADLTIADEDTGKTILHLLIEENLPAACILAAAVGYDLKIKANNGEDAIDMIINQVINGAWQPETALFVIGNFCHGGKLLVGPRNIEQVENSSIADKDSFLEKLDQYVSHETLEDADIGISGLDGMSLNDQGI